jgi:hypothetical protein
MTILTSPHDLLAAVPFLMGFQPEESLIILGIKSEDSISKLSILRRSSRISNVGRVILHSSSPTQKKIMATKSMTRYFVR